MTFSLDLDDKGFIEVVCFKDRSLKMTREEYDEYLKDISDHNKLKFVEGANYETCTRFQLKKTLDYKAIQEVMDSQVSVEMKKGKAIPKMSLKYIFVEMRMALVGIKNPIAAKDPLEFKRDSDQYANENLIAALHGAGVLMDLHTARQNQNSQIGDEKKS